MSEEDKDTMTYFMTKMTQEEFDERMKSYPENIKKNGFNLIILVDELKE